jgi:hypothetical protein
MLRGNSCEIAILEKLLQRRERRRGRPRGRRLVRSAREGRREGRRKEGRKDVDDNHRPFHGIHPSVLPFLLQSVTGGNKLVGCPCPESRIPIWTPENHNQSRKNKNPSMPQNLTSGFTLGFKTKETSKSSDVDQEEKSGPHNLKPSMGSKS